MAVPDFQTIMLPILEYLSDGATRAATPDVTAHLGERFKLTPDDLEERLPSGVQTTLYNRTQWAVTYLVKAGLLERPARARLRITDLGRAALATKPARIDIPYLRQYPDFLEFQAKTRQHENAIPGLPVVPTFDQNPEELLYGTYETLRQSVETDVLDRLQSEALSWEFFEQLVVDLLSRMGFGANVEETGRRVTKRSGDDGIDGVIDEDRLGLDAVYLQAKKYGAKMPVGRPALQAFAGSLEGQRAAKGVFITTSSSLRNRRSFAVSAADRALDGKTLARLMYEHSVGVRTKRTLDIKRVDEAYFEGDV
jgi:restriction system protein